MKDIQKEIDRVSRAGGGTIYIRKDEYYQKGVVNLKSNINLIGLDKDKDEKN